jgi:hypothetical protein
VAQPLPLLVFLTALGLPAATAAPGSDERSWEIAAENGRISDDLFVRARRMMHGWLPHADRRTLLLPDRLLGLVRGRPNEELVYRPHNSGADLYPYLVITAHLTEPELYRGRMLEMLRNEVRYTNGPDSIPGELDLRSGRRGAPSFFGAGEYAKDGLVAVTELLGRTPWYHRMVDMMTGFRERAPVATRFGRLPADEAELNGDVLQTLARLAPMSGDPRFLEWAEQIGDAYVEEILPGSHHLPGGKWDFAAKTGDGQTRFRDHGNEIILGLVLLQALETDHGRPRAARYAPVLRAMLDRTLASANPDGMLYNVVRNHDLQPVDRRLADNWGYVYGAIHTWYQVTGEARYREAVRRVLTHLPAYRGYDWENGSHDGYADAIESALYLVAREPVPEALGWIESEMKTLLAYQQGDGTVERWYGDGNWSRTVLLYALMKTQGARLDGWTPGVRLGAVRDGPRLLLSLESGAPWTGKLCLDHARHRRVLNLKRNYVRLNEWPEWFTVDENTLYTVRDADTAEERRYLGSELIAGVPIVIRAGQRLRLIVEAAADEGARSRPQ